MLSSSLFFLVSVIFTCFSDCIQIDDSIQISDLSKEHFVDISSFLDGNTINIAFSFVNQNVFSATFVMVDFNQYYNPALINLTSFNSKSQSDFAGIMDLSSMQLGKTQYINLIKLSGKNFLYLTVFNLDPNTSLIGNARPSVIPFSIIINQSNNKQCNLCQKGGTQSNDSQICQCFNCNLGYTDPYCSHKKFQLSQQSMITTYVSGPFMTFFQISPSQIDGQLSVKISAGQGQFYFQNMMIQGQFACYTNVNPLIANSGLLSVSFDDQTKYINIPSSQYSISVTFIVYTSTNTQVYIQYIQNASATQEGLEAIIIGVVGAVLIIFIGIGIWYLCRNPVQQQIQLKQQIKKQFSPQQISKYFPSVILSEVLSDSKQLQHELREQFRKKQNQCIICLSPLMLDQNVKITYCHHIFHQKCLLQWFNKHLNCPYCRCEFVKSKVIEYYQQTVKCCGVSHPSDVQLAHTLIKLRKQNKIKQQKDQKCEQSHVQLTKCESIKTITLNHKPFNENNNQIDNVQIILKVDKQSENHSIKRQDQNQIRSQNKSQKPSEIIA